MNGGMMEWILRNVPDEVTQTIDPAVPALIHGPPAGIRLRSENGRADYAGVRNFAIAALADTC
jgi:hypothetical protein